MGENGEGRGEGIIPLLSPSQFDTRRKKIVRVSLSRRQAGNYLGLKSEKSVKLLSR